MSLDVPTDIDERGANYHAWCVVCRLRETVCTCYEISNGQLRGRCESVPHSGPVLCLAETQHRRERGKGHQQPNSTSSGVGTDTRIDCTQTSRHRGCDPDKRSSYVVVAQQTTQLPGAGNAAGLDVDPFPPRAPASPCRSERHCGDPSNGLWRDCCDSSRGTGFFQ